MAIDCSDVIHPQAAITIDSARASIGALTHALRSHPRISKRQTTTPAKSRHAVTAVVAMSLLVLQVVREPCQTRHNDGAHDGANERDLREHFGDARISSKGR
jgi:hypothetical protein